MNLKSAHSVPGSYMYNPLQVNRRCGATSGCHICTFLATPRRESWARGPFGPEGVGFLGTLPRTHHVHTPGTPWDRRVQWGSARGPFAPEGVGFLGVLSRTHHVHTSEYPGTAGSSGAQPHPVARFSDPVRENVQNLKISSVYSCMCYNCYRPLKLES